MISSILHIQIKNSWLNVLAQKFIFSKPHPYLQFSVKVKKKLKIKDLYHNFSNHNFGIQ